MWDLGHFVKHAGNHLGDLANSCDVTDEKTLGMQTAAEAERWNLYGINRDNLRRDMMRFYRSIVGMQQG